MQLISLRLTGCALLALLVPVLPLSAATFDFSTGLDYGFTNGTNTNGSWSFTSNSWQLTYGNSSDVSLLSPILTASGGDVTLQFNHSQNFEFPWDGGIVEFALNGGAFNRVSAFSQNGYDSGQSLDSSVSAILGNSMFSGSADARTSIADLGTLAAGDLLQIRWHSASDPTISPNPPNWVLGLVDVSSTAGPVTDARGPNATEAIPEPATLALAGTAFAAAFFLRKYNTRK